MKATDKLLIGALALLLAVIAAPFFYEPLYAQTYGILKGKEVRVIDATSIKVGSWDSDGGNPGHHVTVNFSTNTAEFYTGQTMSTAVNFVSGSYTWMHLNSPVASGVHPNFDNGFQTAGSFIATGGGTFSGAAVQYLFADAAEALIVDSTDSTDELTILGDGDLWWGSPSLDTNLYRAAANSLKTDDDFTIGTLASCDHIQTDANGKLSCNSAPSEKAWTFISPSGSSGTFYYGGYYDFNGADSNFNPSATMGTADISYAAHMIFVCAAGASGGTDTVVRITGTSITDTATRTAADTQDITMDDAGAAGAFYESSKKWIGLVTMAKQSGPDLLCDFGWAKYWDNNNTDFTVAGLEVTLLAAANDDGFNARLLHHKASGWTYTSGAGSPVPPTAIASMQTDHVTEFELANGQNAAWKRSDLSTAISGSGSEGTIWEITTTANKAVELGNILMRITQ